jgi:protein TonB
MSASLSSTYLPENGPQNRVLMIGIGVSILVHMSILFLFPGMRQSAPASAGPTILTATLSSRVASPPPAIIESKRPPEPEIPKPVVKPPPEAPKPLLTRPDSAPSSVAPKVAEPAPAPVQQQSSASASAPASATRAPEVQAPAASSAPATAPRAVESADTGNLDQYRVALLGAANRYKRYPAIAMEKGWQGRVDVRIVIGANGMTQSITVKTSSGFEILDKTAIDMVTKAKPMTPIPVSLRGREFTVDIPVIFSLQTG